jgi:hypothetical protein
VEVEPAAGPALMVGAGGGTESYTKVAELLADFPVPSVATERTVYEPSLAPLPVNVQLQSVVPVAR